MTYRPLVLEAPEPSTVSTTTVRITSGCDPHAVCITDMSGSCFYAPAPTAETVHAVADWLFEQGIDCRQYGDSFVFDDSDAAFAFMCAFARLHPELVVS